MSKTKYMNVSDGFIINSDREKEKQSNVTFILHYIHTKNGSETHLNTVAIDNVTKNTF